MLDKRCFKRRRPRRPYRFQLVNRHRRDGPSEVLGDHRRQDRCICLDLGLLPPAISTCAIRVDGSCAILAAAIKIDVERLKNPRPFWSHGIVVEKTASVNHPQLRMALSVRGLI